MAAPKIKSDDDETTADAPARTVAPNSSARPNDTPLATPVAAHPNSTFADRAKSAGKNKRVDASESKQSA